jgi:hypothetical protein
VSSDWLSFRPVIRTHASFKTSKNDNITAWNDQKL